jgi:hypothetical protein
VRSEQTVERLSNDRAELLTALREVMSVLGSKTDDYPDVTALVEKVSRYLCCRLGQSADSWKMTQEEIMSPATKSSRSVSVSVGSASLQESTSHEESPMETDELSGARVRGESKASTEVGSPDRQRELTANVDLDLGRGMPGYAGKMSEAAWLQRVRTYLAGITPSSLPEIGTSEFDPEGTDGSGMSFLTDDEDLLIVNEDHVDPSIIPFWQAAMVLTEAYFHSVQGAFRFVQRGQFYSELCRMYEFQATGNMRHDWSQRAFLSLANILWATGARWLQQTGLNNRQVPGLGIPEAMEHHTIYFARARALGLDNRVQLDHPSIGMVQGLALLSFYLLTNSSVHR